MKIEERQRDAWERRLDFTASTLSPSTFGAIYGSPRGKFLLVAAPAGQLVGIPFTRVGHCRISQPWTYGETYFGWRLDVRETSYRNVTHLARQAIGWLHPQDAAAAVYHSAIIGSERGKERATRLAAALTVHAQEIHDMWVEWDIPQRNRVKTHIGAGRYYEGDDDLATIWNHQTVTTIEEEE